MSSEKSYSLWIPLLTLFKWSRLRLKGRTRRVPMNEEISSGLRCHAGVLRGSVLKPLLKSSPWGFQRSCYPHVCRWHCYLCPDTGPATSCIWGGRSDDPHVQQWKKKTAETEDLMLDAHKNQSDVSTRFDSSNERWDFMDFTVVSPAKRLQLRMSCFG